mgnify:FL=1
MSNYLADRRKELGLTMKQVAEAVGVSEATVSRWESGQIANMRRDRIGTYAKVLQVRPTFIMTGEPESPETQKAPTLNKKDERDIKKKMDEMLEIFDSADALMFDGEPLDDETRQLLRESYENQLRITKQLAKAKFTPKKYKEK